MINSFNEVERIFVCQQNSLVTAPITFPSTIPFPTALTSGSIVDLCSITVPVNRRHETNVFFITASINWEMTSAASTEAEPPGTAQVAFEFERDDFVIYRQIDTLSRPPGVDTAVTTFSTVNLAHLNVHTNCGCSPINRIITFRLRANNILLNPTFTTTASVGAVTLKVEELRCRS